MVMFTKNMGESSQIDKSCMLIDRDREEVQAVEREGCHISQLKKERRLHAVEFVKNLVIGIESAQQKKVEKVFVQWLIWSCLTSSVSAKMN